MNSQFKLTSQLRIAIAFLMLLFFTVEVSAKTLTSANNGADSALTTSTVADSTTVAEVKTIDFVDTVASALALKQEEVEDIKAKEHAISNTKNEIVKQRLNDELEVLRTKLEQNEKDLLQLTTGGLVESFDDVQFKEEDVDWKKEVTEVLKPLMSEIKSLTSGQREKEQLKQELEYYQNQLTTVNLAHQHLSQLSSEKMDNAQVSAYIAAITKRMAKRKNEVESRIQVLTVKQQEEAKRQASNKDKSVLIKIRDVIKGTLWHLFLSLAAGVFIYSIINLGSRQLNRIDTNNKKNVLFWVRACQFFLRIIAILLAVAAYTATLSAFGEWALMSISILLLFGLLLSLKDVLPKYFVEMRTILNLGSIREGERVIYNGVPWLVQNLDFYTEIYNRDLGATLRLPIAEVADLKSRSTAMSELWFPTRKDDYVILEDGTYGQVIRQSPDTVLIDQLGSLISYQTQDYLSAKPRNLSRSRFTIQSEIGLDYQYQADIVYEMRIKLEKFIQNDLMLQEFKKYVSSIHVEFSQAANSSLNYVVILLSKGSGAAYYNKMTRWLQASAVSCCNQYGWEIPFEQLTLNVPSNTLVNSASLNIEKVPDPNSAE